MTTDPDSLMAARKLVALLESARSLPLRRSEVRLSRPEAYRLVEAIREHAAAGPVMAAAEAVKDAVYQARHVPLTDEVRFHRDQIRELVRRLRAAGV